MNGLKSWSKAVKRLFRCCDHDFVYYDGGGTVTDAKYHFICRKCKESRTLTRKEIVKVLDYYTMLDLKKRALEGRPLYENCYEPRLTLYATIPYYATKEKEAWFGWPAQATMEYYKEKGFDFSYFTKYL